MRHWRIAEPETIVTVVETSEFQRRARAILSDAERLELVELIARNPTTGGGVRKFRFARDGGGKSGGYRVIHFFSPDDGPPVILFTVLTKNEKANLTKTETEAVKTLGEILSATFRGKR